MDKSEYRKKYREENKDKQKEHERKYYVKNKDKIRERTRKYREENKDKQKEHEREYYVKNGDKIRKDKNKYREENKDKLRERERKYREENKDKMREDRNKRYKKDPNFKLGSLIRGRIREALKNNNIKKTSKSAELLGCSILEAREHIEKQFKKGMTWDNHGFKGWHIDHIMPCASFDLTDSDQQKKCFHYTNLQPLWAHENMSKGAKIPLDKEKKWCNIQ
jgi:hypothetical protein